MKTTNRKQDAFPAMKNTVLLSVGIWDWGRQCRRASRYQRGVTLLHLLAVWTGVNYLISLSPNFLFCKIAIITLISWGFCEN